MIINDHQKELGRQMPNGRVCAKQQCQCNNQIHSIQAESGIHATQLRMPTSFDTTFKGVKQFALQAKWDLMAAHDVIIANHIQQTFHANKKRCASDLYHVGDHMYLSTQYLTLPKGRVRKLVPKYIGPYKVVKAYNEASTVTLELPAALIA